MANPDVYVRSYTYGNGYDVAPGYFARDSNGNIITDQTAANGQNKSASGGNLTYYSTPNAATESEVSINNALVLPSPNYMSQVAAAGTQYGNLMANAEAVGAAGADPTGAYLAAESVLLNFAPHIGPFDPQYADGATKGFFPAFTDAGNVGAGVFFGAANKANPDITSQDALQLFGMANQIEGGQDRSSQYGLSALATAMR